MKRVLPLWIAMLSAGLAHAQLLEMEVRPASARSTIPVFRDYPDDAALIVTSSLNGLRFDSNVGVVADLSTPNEGEYRIMVRPWRQTITVTMAGYRQARFTIPASQARDVLYFTVEPVKSDAVALIPVNVRVNGHPDAVLFIDGQQVDLSRSIPMEAGTHLVRVEKLGFLTIEREIAVSMDRNFFEFDLQRVSQRRVVVRTNPAGARIRINGIERTETTPVDFFQFPGEYGLELTLSGYRTVNTQMEVTSTGANEFAFNLSRIAGDLTLRVSPANARIYINEAEVTGQRLIAMNPGTHVLRAQANGHDTYQTQFEMQEGTPLTLDVALKPHTGSARFTIRPIDARTVLYGPNGSLVQEWSGSNIVENLPVGRYRYVVRLPGSADHDGELFITRDEEQDVLHSFNTPVTVAPSIPVAIPVQTPLAATEPQPSATEDRCGTPVTDSDGNAYRTIRIGGQCWMAENLRTDRYRDGSIIPNVTQSGQWAVLTSGAWSHYENRTTYQVGANGKLYNWHATSDPRQLCPAGWRMPTDAEWNLMNQVLGEEAGHRLKATSGWNGGGNGSNSSGFNATSAGMRSAQGQFRFTGTGTGFWTSSQNDASTARARVLGNASRALGRSNDAKNAGYSVRCVMD
jgi:uncharacterized protein (TIGR02145 family)